MYYHCLKRKKKRETTFIDLALNVCCFHGTFFVVVWNPKYFLSTLFYNLTCSQNKTQENRARSFCMKRRARTVCWCCFCCRVSKFFTPLLENLIKKISLPEREQNFCQLFFFFFALRKFKWEMGYKMKNNFFLSLFLITASSSRKWDYEATTYKFSLFVVEVYLQISPIMLLFQESIF